MTVLFLQSFQKLFFGEYLNLDALALPLLCFNIFLTRAAMRPRCAAKRSDNEYICLLRNRGSAYPAVLYNQSLNALFIAVGKR